MAKAAAAATTGASAPKKRGRPAGKDWQPSPIALMTEEPTGLVFTENLRNQYSYYLNRITELDNEGGVLVIEGEVKGQVIQLRKSARKIGRKLLVATREGKTYCKLGDAIEE